MASSDRAVLFDLDGTLVDTTYLHALAWWRAADAEGLGRPFADFHRLIGMGGDELLSTIYGDLPDEKATALDEARAEQFSTLHPEVRRIAGAAELLAEVKRRGACVVIGTSGEPDDVDNAMDVLDAEGCIDLVINSSEADNAKPDPEIFQLSLERAGVDAASAVVVGDTIWDVKAAVAAGIRSIGVLTGGHATQDLVGAGARSVHHDCGALLADLDDTELGRLLS